MVFYTGRQKLSDAARQQTSAVVHTQPVITSPPVPVTSAQGPMTSQHREGTAAAATTLSASRQSAATTADSMTFSHTTLYVLL